ncbi:MAG: spondin domain-containing protein [Chloroflexota bacterium]|nr:spondin domain-containing protein [Chloroflexota bacterium]
MIKRASFVLGSGLLVSLLAIMGIMAAGVLSADSGDEQLLVEISLTNLTPGQILSPIFMARHDGEMAPLYTLGLPASEELALMAEDADASGLLADYHPSTNAYVSESMLLTLDDGPIPPGHTVTTQFQIDDDDTYLSFISMLVTTNDAFVGASGLDLSHSRTVNLTAYDAGSEANSESCAYIPGPPCGSRAKDDAIAEGYVYVHNGIHGGQESGLNPATHDWHNPVARMTIKTWSLMK